jgi:hypothetical protein
VKFSNVLIVTWWVWHWIELGRMMNDTEQSSSKGQSKEKRYSTACEQRKEDGAPCKKEEKVLELGLELTGS